MGVAFDKSSGPGWMDGLTSALDGLTAPVTPALVESTPAPHYVMQTGAPPANDTVEREQLTPAALVDKQIKLSPKRLDGYFAMVQRMLASAQLGREFPDAERVLSHLEGMRSLHQIGARGLSFALSRESGLPVYSSWMLLEKSRDHAAANIVDKMSVRRMQLAATDGKQSTVARSEAVNSLRRDEAQLATDRRNVNATWVEPLDLDDRRQCRTFRIVIDRLVAPGLLQRTSVLVEQSIDPSRWAVSPISRDASGVWCAHSDLRKAVMTGAHQSLEDLAVVLGRSWPSACVELSRGTIGPIWFEGVQGAPEAVATLIAENPAAVVGNFTLQHATCERPQEQVPQPAGGSFIDRIMRHVDKEARLERWVRQATDTVRAMSTWTSSSEQTWVCSAEIAAQLEAAVDTHRITVRKIY